MNGWFEINQICDGVIIGLFSLTNKNLRRDHGRIFIKVLKIFCLINEGCLMEESEYRMEKTASIAPALQVS